MSDLSHLKSKLLAEQVQELIYQYILDHSLTAGMKLPNEFDLARQFNVGRSTIREAVKLLISQGILEVRRGSGTYIISTTPSDMDPLGLRRFEDKMSLALDLADLRMMLEPGIAEMAALNATAEDILRLRGLCDLTEERILTGSSYIKEDIAFHTCVAECSKNKVVEQLVPMIDTAVMMFVNVTHTKLKNETIMTHRAVTEAIADHDPTGARSAMMMHMAFNRDLIKKLMKEQEGTYAFSDH
ncbi:MAG: FadR family transcriptional regulator [Clostridiales bacterium]|nr:FadR family transcriptional regulator [Clostridiales bacterium]